MGEFWGRGGGACHRSVAWALWGHLALGPLSVRPPATVTEPRRRLGVGLRVRFRSVFASTDSPLPALREAPSHAGILCSAVIERLRIRQQKIHRSTRSRSPLGEGLQLARCNSCVVVLQRRLGRPLELRPRSALLVPDFGHFGLLVRSASGS